MSIEIVLVMAVIVFFAYLVKGITGFGEGIIVISIFLLFLDIKTVLPLALVLAFIGGWYQFFHFRKDMHKKILLLMSIPIILGVIIGTYLLKNWQSDLIKRIFAGIIILYSLRLFFSKRNSGIKKKVTKSLGVGVGFVGGVLDGLFGIGGIPIIMYLTHQKLRKAVFRATCVVSFILLATVRMATYAYSGFVTWETLTTTVYLLPAVFLGSLAGIKIHKKVDELLFYRITAGLLFMIGVVLLVRK